MIAYNSTSLDNRIIEEQTAEALATHCITKEEHTQIGAAYPVPFYTPNIFIRIGLFILTVIIAVFTLGLLALLTSAGSNSFGVLFIFSGLVCYGILEAMVHSKRHFQSGVDDALLLMAGILVLSGISIAVDHLPMLTLFLLIFTVALYSTLRFADQLMALLAYAALLAILFKAMTSLGGLANTLLPFLIMAVSIAVYFLAAALSSNSKLRHYHVCTTVVIKAACLLSFYLAGNYFVVREAGVALLNLPLQPGQSLPMGWLFWILTIATPLFYIFQGIRKKDVIFLWVGLGLIAAAVLTIRNYYHVLPVEWALVLGGALLIAVSYVLIKHLRVPRHGFTGEVTDDRHLLQSLPIESLVIAESFTTPPTPSNDFRFGGGSGGGGGAGGQY
ncbi:MAG TPA: hypothetical protein VF939_05935 [Puia sp.]